MAKRTASTTGVTTRRKSARTTASKKAGRTSGSTAGTKKVVIDRRTGDRRSKNPSAAPPKLERRQKVNRRRQIDPTTCERDYSDDEVEFMNALDLYKRKSGRMFPTCSEVLEVIRSLGYVKQEAPTAVPSSISAAERESCSEADAMEEIETASRQRLEMNA